VSDVAPDDETNPDLGRIVLTAEQIRDRIAELGAQITRDYAGRAPLLVGVLKGAFVFMADLARATSWRCRPTAARPRPAASCASSRTSTST
jgi:hypoxanthine-guanine phosphoribosyltransferase